MSRSKAIGLHAYRCKNNPAELIAANLWQKRDVLGDLLGDGTFGGRVVPSERDEQVAATVMQWLGSPVGRCFLEELNEALPKAGKPAAHKRGRGR